MAGRQNAARVGFVAIAAVALAVAACGSGPAKPTSSGAAIGTSGPALPGRTAAPTRTPRPGSSATAIDPIETAVTGVLPQSATFAGVVFTVTSAGLTNTHPYTMFGSPRPGPDLFGVLQVTASNTNARRIDYSFDDEAFVLRTWSGRILPSVHHPGARAFSNLKAGESADDEVVFGLPEPDALDGAALLIGAGKDARASIFLTTEPVPDDIPAAVAPVAATPIHVVPIEWVVEGGSATYDAPPKAVSRAGSRADEGTMFVTLTLTGTVKGSKYGQTTVSTDLIRLRVNGESLKSVSFEGKAGVREGTALTMTPVWVVPSDARSFELVVSEGTAIPLVVTP